MCTTGGTITQAVPVAAGAEEAGPLLTIPLGPVDAVTVTTLVGNVTDLLAMDAGPARRPFIGDATRGFSPLFEDGWMYERSTGPPGSSPGSRRSRRCGTGNGSLTRWSSTTRRSS